MTSEQLKARGLAIARAFDDPLRRALMSAIKSKPGSRNASQEAYNAYHRVYRKTTPLVEQTCARCGKARQVTRPAARRSKTCRSCAVTLDHVRRRKEKRS